MKEKAQKKRKGHYLQRGPRENQGHNKCKAPTQNKQGGRQGIRKPEGTKKLRSVNFNTTRTWDDRESRGEEGGPDYSGSNN